MQSVFKVVKALGFTIEKRSELELAIAEAEAGKTIKCSSLDELFKKKYTFTKK